MAERARENATWRKGKSPILSEYSAEHRKLMAGIAARGFLSLPGHAYDAENDLELHIKGQLSELNFKIISETIERELKQAGADTDLAYKVAAVAWELDKQELLIAWDHELAFIKQGMAAEDELLAILAIETKKRGVTLLESKTALELQTEAHRRTIAELDGATAAYEISLANAKLLTAQKKLEIIPILQEIVAKEEALLAQEQLKAEEYVKLMAAEQEVITKKETRLLPAVLALTNISEQYTGELSRQIDIEGDIAGEKVTQSGYAVENARLRNIIAGKEVEVEAARLEVQDAKRDLSDVKSSNEATLADASLADAYEMIHAQQQHNATLLASDRTTDTHVLDQKRTAINRTNLTKEVHSQRITNAEIGRNRDLANIDADKTNRIAVIRATKTITSKLTHVIG